MSAIAGIYQFNDDLVQPDLLQRLGKHLTRRCPDGGREVIDGKVGMAHQAFHTHAEAKSETQPVVSPFGGLLAWDGRLDNSVELINELRVELADLCRTQTREISPNSTTVVLAAYRKWGTDFVARLIGDFAFSLWDPHSNLLLLARDFVGPRTLYYSKTGSRLIWSTELSALVELLNVANDINEEYVADYLTRHPDPCSTPYRPINAVPPGSLVLAHGQKVWIRTFWKPKFEEPIRCRDDRDYEQMFRSIFREAVGCRLRVEGSVWAELSGGLDSSAVVCTANQIISKGEASVSSLTTVSSVFDEARGSDERKYIQLVEQKVGKAGIHLSERDHPLLPAPASDYVANIPSPVLNFAEYYKALCEAMRAAGVRVLLSGKGGDEVVTSMNDPGPELIDLLMTGELFRLHKQLRAWNQRLKKTYADLLWQSAILPSLSRGMQVRFGRVTHYQSLKLIDDSFARRNNVRERLLGPEDPYSCGRAVDRFRITWFLRLVRQLANGFWQEFCDFEITYPFTHRPLVEFMLAIPFEQAVRPGESRSILRRALSDVLPGGIAARKGKTLNTEALLQALKREAPRLRQLFTNAAVCKRGYINEAALNSAIVGLENGNAQGALPLVALCPLENWLRQHD